MSRNGSWRGTGEFMLFEPAEIEIGGRRIGRSDPLFAIAEIGLNHGGSVDRALALVDAAAAAGATAIKLQTLDAAGLVAPGAPAPAHVPVESIREFLARFELDEAAHGRLIERARSRGLAVIATPLCEDAVDMLDRLGVDAFKIASGDVTWTQLIARCARTRKPLVISTGMSVSAPGRARVRDWADLDIPPRPPKMTLKKSEKGPSPPKRSPQSAYSTRARSLPGWANHWLQSKREGSNPIFCQRCQSAPR